MKFTPSKPVVESRKDNTEYFNLATLNKNKLHQIIDAAEERNPKLLEHWATDTFIESMQKNFDAQILLPKRKKHMIVLYGPTINDKALISRLKKYFEAEVVIPDWDGKKEIEDNQTTLLITEVKPPYIQPYNALSIDGARQLLAA